MADVRLTATNPEDSSVVPVACDAAGRLLLEEPQVITGPPGPDGEQGSPGEQGPPGQDGQDGDPFSGNFAGDVTFGGSASFAGILKVGNRASGEQNKSGGDILPNGGIYTQKLATDADTTYAFRYTRGRSTGGGPTEGDKFAVYADGSASFARGVNAGGRDPGATNTRGVRIAVDSNNGGCYVQAKSSATPSPLMAFQALHGTTEKFKVMYDGRAEFAGDVRVGAPSTDGVVIYESGQILSKAAGDTTSFQINRGTSNNFRVDSTGDTYIGTGINAIATNANISLNADGSATFAGNKAGFTAEGHLWCTTTRGETVMLDFTANGMGQWVEYTPTTRLEEIRDNLDANRGDTGEMPADTP